MFKSLFQRSKMSQAPNSDLRGPGLPIVGTASKAEHGAEDVGLKRPENEAKLSQPDVFFLPGIDSYAMSPEQSQSNQDSAGPEVEALGLQGLQIKIGTTQKGAGVELEAVGLKGLQIEAEATQKGAATKKLNINNVSNDIIHLIFDQLTVPGRVYLGLTSKNFYAFLKLRHKGLPSLLEPVCCVVIDWGINQECTPGCPYLSLKLKDLLQDWSGIGNGYRFLYEYPSKFLKNEVYAVTGSRRVVEEGKRRERELIERYQDYATVNDAWEARPRKGGRRLPKPHNMGDVWYPFAFDVIREDIVQWDSIIDWINFWAVTKVSSAAADSARRYQRWPI